MRKPKESNMFSWTEISCADKCMFKYLITYIKKKVPMSSTDFYMDRGTLGHYGMELLYDNMPMDTIESEMYLKLEEILAPKIEHMMLEEKMALEDQIPFLLDLLKMYRNRYKDEFEFVVSELPFHVKLAKGIYVKGSIDGIGVDSEGRMWLLEHKFTKYPVKEDDLLVNGQIMLYYYIAKCVFGLPIYGVRYNQIKTEPFKEPKLNANGTMSRVAIYTTWDIYKKALIDAGLNEFDYMDMQSKLSLVNPIDRVEFIKTDAEVNRGIVDILQRIYTIKYCVKKDFFPRRDGKMTCRGCELKEICVENLKGQDITWHLENLFKSKGTKNVDTSVTKDKLKKLRSWGK